MSLLLFPFAPARVGRPASNAGARRACFLGLASLLWVLTLASASAQSPTSAIVVEWGDPRADSIAASLRGACIGAGYSPVPDDAVRAARLIGGVSGSLSVDAAMRLRDALQVELFVWAAVRTHANGQPMWALRLVDDAGLHSAFGTSERGEATADITRALVAHLRGDASPRSADVPSPEPTSPSVAPPSGPAAPGPNLPQQGPSPSAGPPAAEDLAVEAPSAETPFSAGPAAQAAPFQSTPSPLDMGSAGTAAPVRPASPPGPSAVHRSVLATARAILPHPSSTETLEPPAPAEAEPTPARTMRVRTALVGLAGIEGYGYGIGLRLMLPIAQAGSGDNAFSLGFDLALTYDQFGVDANNTYDAVQVPGAVHLMWRFNTGPVVVVPRIGVAAIVRAAFLDGPSAAGERQDLISMFVVGLSVSPWIGDAQLYLGVDLTIGPRVGVLFAAGVAL